MSTEEIEEQDLSKLKFAALLIWRSKQRDIASAAEELLNLIYEYAKNRQLRIDEKTNEEINVKGDKYTCL
jgi:hypothetical protein